jgi:FKBP-type peptidyl-prolyl cis-trans isomerase FklB
MRKFGFFAVALAAISFASCTAQAPKAEFKNEIDSLSYMFGVANTQGLDYYISGQLGVDTTYMADFIAGVVAGVSQNTPKDVAYNAGLQIGQQITGRIIEGINNQLFAGDSTQALNQDNFIAGFVSALKKKPGMVTPEEASAYVQTHADAIKAKALEAKYGENKAAGEKFLAENAKKEGVKTTESGLQYKVIKEGKGAIPTETSTVKVHYKGTLVDGTEFDSSYNRNEPTSFRANQVIKGWTEALTMMPVGSKWELYIPQELAYGTRETGDIKPFSTLIFEVELLEVVQPKKK